MVKIEARYGAIAQVKADALVNAANNHFWMGSGVAGALKRAGGWEIEVEAMNQGPVAVGEAVVTGAGKLPAKYVIHAAVMGQDLQTDAEKITQATRNALRRAADRGVKTIAFPALGTGVGGFPLHECACLMIKTVREFCAGNNCLEKVIFVLRAEEDYQTFRGEIEKG